MALAAFNAAKLRGANTSLQQVKAWLAGSVGCDSIASKPRIFDHRG